MDVVVVPVRLALDLGTTHTVAVVRRGDQQPRALLFDGSPLLASGVFVDAAGASHTGRDAQRLAGSEPERFEPHPKRRIDEGRVLLGSHEVAVEQLLAAGLRRVADEARVAGIDPVGATVLTCPADWGQPRRAVLLAAAWQAGLGQVRLLDEPIAAATYCMQVLGQQVPPGGCLGIFDFGGGTLDVAVVRREPAGLRVLATGGLDDLGGLDVDSALVAHLGQLVAVRDPGLWDRLRDPKGTSERRDRQAFWAEVRAAKEMLSRTSAAPVHVPGREEPMHLTREEVERIAGPLVARAVDEMRRVLQRAEVEPAALAGLLLVGGSSRMPLVASRLHARLGVAPSVPEQPELPVAYGALLSGMAVAPSGPASGSGGVSYPVSSAFGASPVSGDGVSYPVSSVLGASPVSGGPVSPVSGGSGSVWAGIGAGGQAGPGVRPDPRAPQGAAGVRPVPYLPPGRPLSPVKRRRRPVLRVVMAGLTVAALVGCVTGVVRGGQWLADSFQSGSPDNPFGGLGLSRTGLGGGGELTEVSAVPDPGPGAMGLTVAGGHVVSAVPAEPGTRTMDVVSRPVAGGEPRWSTNLKLEPTSVRLTAANGLIVVDGDDSATDRGERIRAVLQESDGKLLWKGVWDDSRTDVVFFGGDVVAEVRDGFDNAVIRVDLRTGKEKWRRKKAGMNLYLIDAHRVEAMRQWTGPGVLPGSVGPLGETVAAGDVVVELDPEQGTGHLLGAGDGRSRGSGKLPLVDDHWTAFEGFVVGQLNSDVEPGNSVVAGYSVPQFKQAWKVQLAAGETVDRVKPCGEQLVCVAVDAQSNEQDRTIALDVRSGEQRWSVKVEWSADEEWLVAEGGLVFGEGLFGSVREVRVLDGAGAPVREPVKGATVRAVSGGRMVLQEATVPQGSDKVRWFVWVAEVGSGKATAAVDVGESQPEVVSLAGDGLGVVTADRRTLVLRVGKFG